MGIASLISSILLGLLLLHILIQRSMSTGTHFKALMGCEHDSISPDNVLTTVAVSRPCQCAMTCLRTKNCLAFNICGRHDPVIKCGLISSIQSQCSDLTHQTDCSYLQKLGDPCQNGGTWLNPTCRCVDGFAGVYCERYIRSCKEGKDLGISTGAYYYIQPFGSPVAYRLYCNLEYASTAYAFVRRNPPYYGSVNYDAKWKNYKKGWGSVDSAEYFVGLETMYQLMKYEAFQLHVYGYYENGNKIINFFYSNFTIQSQKDNYRMDYLHGFNDSQTGDDGLGGERPRDFCTKDRDCGACAASQGGGWWYTSGCGGSPLMSSISNFVWPVDGAGVELLKVIFQLDHMAYYD